MVYKHVSSITVSCRSQNKRGNVYIKLNNIYLNALVSHVFFFFFVDTFERKTLTSFVYEH